MTGFGNFLYFDGKQDFSVTRAASMWLRINYFPLLLSYTVGIPLDLLYIVPLHTAAFFITMATCYVAALLGKAGSNNDATRWSHGTCNAVALSLCLLLHVVFYETPAVNLLKILFGDEILFRFQSDKYSAVLGIISGYFWGYAQRFIQWAHTPQPSSSGEPGGGGAVPQLTQQQQLGGWAQRVGGVALIALWWMLFGHITDKYTYNPVHPFVFWMPIFGWLALRNGSKYLTEVHSTALEFFGKITLETYVLQFNVFMCKNVQNIPVVIPGSGPDGTWVLKTLNMLVTGVGFVALAYWARQITITTQTTLTDLLVLLLRKSGGGAIATIETVALKDFVDGRDSGDAHAKGSSSSNGRALHAKESGDV